MSYQVLARKWRPQQFTDVVGQEPVLTTLANALALGRIHHAYLLSGTRGVGKTTIARLLAKGLNCETGITATWCGKCNTCNEIEHGRFLDLIEIDAASRTKVEDTRELLENVAYVPARGRFKIYLIDEVHMLSRHSFNALLKTLEEPPGHVKFILATTEHHKLPLTILSRCLQLNLKTLDTAHIYRKLESILHSEQIEIDKRALQLLASAADGSMRDALSLTEQAIAMGHGMINGEVVSVMLGTMNTEQPLALIEALVNADGKTMMAQLAQYASRGIDWDNLLVEMLSILHRIAMGKLIPDSLNDLFDEQPETVLRRLRELTRRITNADLQLYYHTLLVGRQEQQYAPNRRIGVEMTLLRALAVNHDSCESQSRTNTTQAWSPTASTDVRLTDVTTKLLQARTALRQHQENHKLSAVTKPKVRRSTQKDQEKLLAEAAMPLDQWGAQVHRLSVPTLVRQFAMNTWKEELGANTICLHLRSSQRHLNSSSSQRALCDALSLDLGRQIKLTVIEDDNPAVKTPLEWQQALYDDKRIQARQAISVDTHLKMLRSVFDAKLDEDSIKQLE